jgi:hypothetical protein
MTRPSQITRAIARNAEKPWLILRLREVAKFQAEFDSLPDVITKQASRARLERQREILRTELKRRGFVAESLDGIEEDGRREARGEE